MRRNKLSIFLCIIAMLVVGFLSIQCTTQKEINTGYATAVGSQFAYDTTFTTLADLHKQGLITDAQKDRAIKYGRAYMKAHNAAVEALASYVENSNDGTKAAYLAAMANSASAWAELLQYVKPLIKE